jgi:hypothetical protein
MVWLKVNKRLECKVMVWLKVNNRLECKVMVVVDG